MSSLDGAVTHVARELTGFSDTASSNYVIRRMPATNKLNKKWGENWREKGNRGG